MVNNMNNENEKKMKKLIHQRKIDITGFQINDKEFEIQGILHDIRGHDMELIDRDNLLPAGKPLHLMTLNIIINDEMCITKAEAITLASPFNLCKSVNPNYLSLIGMTIGTGWNRKIKKILAHEKGCTHLNEMLSQMATVAFQTVWGSRPASKETIDARVINTCYGYQENGDVVLRYLEKQK